MNIKDFLNVFIETYKIINADKTEAKRILKHYKEDLKVAKQTLSNIKNAYKYLSEIYLVLDKDERKEYVQDTLDLINYGPKYKYGDRCYDYNHYYAMKFEQLIKELSTYIDDIKHLIRHNNYKTVIEKYTTN